MIYHTGFSGYEEIEALVIDPSPKHKSAQLNRPILDAPPLPSRAKQKQTISRNRKTIATPKFRDGMAADTDSDYEYVSNSVTKNNVSAIGSCKSMMTMGKIHTLDPPPLPSRAKQKQTISRNRKTIASPRPSNFKNGMAIDAHSDYEYVSNSVTNNNASALGTCESMITLGKAHICACTNIYHRMSKKI